MKTKIIKSILLSSLILPVLGCSNNADETTSTSTNNTYNVSIAVNNESLKNVIKSLIDNYSSSLDYNLNVTYLVDVESNSISSIPDLFLTYDGLADKLAKQGLIEEISETYVSKIETRDNASALEAFKKTNKLNLFPLNYHFGEYLYYDSSIYDEDDVLDFASLITKKEDKKINISNLSGAELFGLFHGNGYDTDFIYDVEGNLASINDNITEGSDNAIMVSNLFNNQGLSTDFYNPSSSYSAIIGGYYQYQDMKLYFDDNLKMAPLPDYTYDSKTYHWSNSIHSQGIAITRSADNNKKEVLFDLALYLSSKDGQERINQILSNNPLLPYPVVSTNKELHNEVEDINQIHMAKDFTYFPYEWSMISMNLFTRLINKNYDDVNDVLTDYHNSLSSLID